MEYQFLESDICAGQEYLTLIVDSHTEERRRVTRDSCSQLRRLRCGSTGCHQYRRSQSHRRALPKECTGRAAQEGKRTIEVILAVGYAWIDPRETMRALSQYRRRHAASYAVFGNRSRGFGVAGSRQGSEGRGAHARRVGGYGRNIRMPIHTVGGGSSSLDSSARLLAAADTGCSWRCSRQGVQKVREPQTTLVERQRSYRGGGRAKNEVRATPWQNYLHRGTENLYARRNIYRHLPVSCPLLLLVCPTLSIRLGMCLCPSCPSISSALVVTVRRDQPDRQTLAAMMPRSRTGAVSWSSICPRHIVPACLCVSVPASNSVSGQRSS